MPPKKCNADEKKCNAEELIEALLDPKVMAAIAEAMAGTISGMIKTTIEEQMKALLDRVGTLESSSEKATEDMAILSEENAALRQRVEQLEAYSKSDNLIFYGLAPLSFADAANSRADDSASSPLSHANRSPGSAPSSVNPSETHGDSETAVITFCTTVLNVPLTRADISIAHRLPKLPTDTKPPGIIVRFTNRRARNEVFYARKGLKRKDVRVYVNEHLTASRASLLREARKLVKEDKLHAAWTNNGMVYIRLSALPTSRAIKIGSVSDLPSG